MVLDCIIPKAHSSIQIYDENWHHPPVLRLCALFGHEQPLTPNLASFAFSKSIMGEQFSPLLRYLHTSVLAVFLTVRAIVFL